MAYIGVQPTDTYLSIASQQITGTGSATYTLDYSVSNEEDVAVFVNNVRQNVSSYTVSGNQLTLGGTISASDECWVLFLGRTVGTKTPAVGSVTNDMLAGSIATSKLANQNIGFRNLIINGDMSIAQRGTSQASAGSSSGEYQTIDRYKLSQGGLGAFTWSQDTDVPTGQGFANSMKFDCTTADASPSANDFFIISQILEGQMLQHLKKGTANAESLTLSFWVKSNKTGTYIAELFDTDNSRFTNKSYSINSASTWEKKTITFDGDTTGAFNNDNGGSLSINFWLGAGTTFTTGSLQTTWGGNTASNRAVGQVNLADNTANEWYITGVQLEVGTSASDFEFLPFDVQMRRCERYYYVFCDRRTSGAYPIREQYPVGSGIGVSHYGNQVTCSIILPMEMRTNPSLDQATGSGWYEYYHDQNSDTFDSFNSIGGNGVKSFLYRNTNQISASVGTCGTINGISAGNSFMAFDAEL